MLRDDQDIDTRAETGGDGTEDASEPNGGEARRVGGRYELVEIAGVGGMATVWRAVLHGPGEFRREVAVKHMKPELASQPHYVEMFFEEARVGSQLQDRNIAQIYDFLEEDGEYFLVMEWVEGIDLATYVRYLQQKGRSIRWELVCAIGIGMLRGLAAAHGRRLETGEPEPILHRDVSPHNILLSLTGSAKVIDFGLSLAEDRLGAPTPPGMAKGKFAYLAPEVVRGARPTPAADQFAAGIVLWQALAGKKLFDGTEPAEVLRRVAEADVPPLHELRSDLPRPLCDLVHRALALHAKDRFASTSAMANELRAVLGAAEHDEDLYHLLAEAVRTTRTELGLGRRTQGPEDEEEIEEEEQVEHKLSAFGILGWIKNRLSFMSTAPSSRS